jgi:hypothetical protein
MAFQTTINVTQAPAVEGDFASSNPRWSVLSMQSQGNDSQAAGFRAGGTQGATPPADAGVFIARFAWADASTGMLLLNVGAGLPTGFIHRAMEGLNYAYFTTPSSTSMFIPAGFPVGEVFSGGDFWVRHKGAGAVTPGMKAFAKLAHTSGVNMDGGTIQFAATATVIAGWIETKWIAGSKGAANELIKMSSQPLG